jgi:diketogulonate reductase-like aldo/keto reductase
MKTTLTLNNGNKVPLIGLGTWKADKDTVAPAVEYAVIKAGYRHIDCASIYGNEKEIGTAFQKIFSSGIKREEVFVTSKLWNTEHHPKNVEAACRQTLKDLQLEYLDLYLIHWGIAFKHGGDSEPLDANGRVLTEPVSIQETWAAMEKLVEKGLVKSIGVANFTTIMLVDLLTYAKIKPVMNQIELHPYLTQMELIDFCKNHHIAVTAYSPLGTPGGLREGDPVLLEDAVIKEIAKSHQKSPAQILLNWSVGRNTIVIPKSAQPERLNENISIFDFELTPTEREKINNLNKNYRFVHPLGWWGLPYFS